eukprot:scaffold188381_cov14-Tisochrysis_lutea.AAC.1
MHTLLSSNPTCQPEVGQSLGRQTASFASLRASAQFPPRRDNSSRVTPPEAVAPNSRGVLLL